jgi:hypothetical protein
MSSKNDLFLMTACFFLAGCETAAGPPECKVRPPVGVEAIEKLAPIDSEVEATFDEEFLATATFKAHHGGCWGITEHVTVDDGNVTVSHSGVQDEYRPVHIQHAMTPSEKEKLVRIFRLIYERRLWNQDDAADPTVTDGGSILYEFSIGNRRHSFTLCNARPEHLRDFQAAARELYELAKIGGEVAQPTAEERLMATLRLKIRRQYHDDRGSGMTFDYGDRRFTSYRWTNDALENQSLGRSLRPGETEKVLRLVELIREGRLWEQQHVRDANIADCETDYEFAFDEHQGTFTLDSIAPSKLEEFVQVTDELLGEMERSSWPSNAGVK